MPVYAPQKTVTRTIHIVTPRLDDLDNDQRGFFLELIEKAYNNQYFESQRPIKCVASSRRLDSIAYNH